MTEQKRAILWIAVSSEVQAEDDKESLEEQRRTGIEWAEANNCDIIKIFVWDGKSRWESDPIQALEDYAAKGWYQYHELRQMWRDQAFDVLICHNHSRLGRSFTMQSWVIENVIRSGALIYRILGGWIQKNDYAGQLALGGFANISEISRLVELRKGAMRKRAERGLSQLNMTRAHLKVRDPITGKEIAVILNEKYRPMWTALAEVVLSGVGKKFWGVELARRGYVNDDGLPFDANVLYKTLNNPSFWGHAVFRAGKAARGKLGRFAYDKNTPPPEGISLVYDVYPPVYTGALAEAVKQEMIRRTHMTGTRRPQNTMPLSGLFVCADCGSSLIVYSKKRNNGSVYYALRCVVAGDKRLTKITCSARRLQPIAPVIEWLNARLLEWIAAGCFVVDEPSSDNARKELLRLEKQLKELQSKIDVLVEEMTMADASLRDVYRQHLLRAKTRYDALFKEHSRLFHTVEAQSNTHAQQNDMLSSLSEYGERALDTLWARPEREINRFFHALFGDYVAVWDVETRNFVRFKRRS